jgi:hypothetical protein
MATVAAVPVALSVASMVMSARGIGMAKAGADQAAAAARANAARRAQEAGFEAEQLRVNAGQEEAAGQIAAREQQRQARLVQSRAIAVAAAGGGSVADPTVVNLLARNAGEGVYRAGLALYQGRERARVLRMQATGKDLEVGADIAGGEAAAQGYILRGKAEATRGYASMFSSASTLFGKYGVGGPSGGATPGLDLSAVAGSGLEMSPVS